MLLLSPAVRAEPVQADPVQADAPANIAGQWQISLSAGLGKVTTPLARRDDLAGNLLPAISYYGERFYLENSFIGYSLVEQEHWYLDLAGSINDDGYFFTMDGVNNFGWWDALGIQNVIDRNFETGGIESGGIEQGGREGGIGYPPGSYQDIERHLSYMAGLSFNWLTDYADVRLALLKDISGVHHGQEQHLTVRKRYQYQQWSWQWQLGLSHKDQQLLNYYYNLRPHELNLTDSWFRLKGSWQYFYGLSVTYQLHPQWALQAFWQKNQLDPDMLLSPLLEYDHYYGRFIGVRYSF